MEKNFEITYLNDLNFLTSFVPAPLKKEHICQTLFRSRSKKEVDLEIKAMTLSQLFSYASLLKSLENRFWLYGKRLPEKGHVYSLTFKSFDNMIFDDCKKKLTNLCYLTYSYKVRDSILKSKKSLLKSRVLSLRKSGFQSSFYGLRAFFKRELFGLKKIKKKSSKTNKITYKSWLLFNLNSIGYLSSFRLTSWTLKEVRLSKKLKKSYSVQGRSRYFKGILGYKSQVLLCRS